MLRNPNEKTISLYYGCNSVIFSKRQAMETHRGQNYGIETVLEGSFSRVMRDFIVYCKTLKAQSAIIKILS